MKSKSKTETKPIYAPQIEGAANTVTGAYNSQAPKISAITDQIGGLAPSLIDKYNNGTPTLNAANDYVTSTLNGSYEQNPELQSVMDRAANQTRNQTAASLGTRGLAGGSAFADIISRNVGNQASDLAFTDYNNWQGRRANAAGMAPSLTAAGEIPLASLQAVADTQQAPLQAAAGMGSSIGGLLGQYTNQKTSSTPSLAMVLAQMAGNAASAYKGG